MYCQYGFLCHMVSIKEICSAHDFNRPKSEVNAHGFNRLKSEVNVTVTLKQYAKINSTKIHANTKFAEICSGHHYSRTEARGRHTAQNGTQHFESQDASTYLIWYSYFKSIGGMLWTRCEDPDT